MKFVAVYEIDASSIEDLALDHFPGLTVVELLDNIRSSDAKLPVTQGLYSIWHSKQYFLAHQERFFECLQKRDADARLVWVGRLDRRLAGIDVDANEPDAVDHAGIIPLKGDERNPAPEARPTLLIANRMEAGNGERGEDARLAALPIHEIDRRLIRIECAQDQAEKNRKRWGASEFTAVISVSIALCSLLFTWISSYRAANQETRDLRGELRAVIQRLKAYPRESMELKTKYPDPQVARQLLLDLTAERADLARQARYIMDRLPKNVSTIEFITIIDALTEIGDFAAAESLLAQARKELQSNNLWDILAIKWASAHLYYLIGKDETGRQAFAEALGAARPSDANDQSDWWAYQTEVRWAQAEALRHKQDVAPHLLMALKHVRALPAAAGRADALHEVLQNIWAFAADRFGANDLKSGREALTEAVLDTDASSPFEERLRKEMDEGTEVVWSDLEISRGQLDEARRHFTRAGALSHALNGNTPDGPYGERLRTLGTRLDEPNRPGSQTSPNLPVPPLP
jgi:hypothetical protein